MALLFELAFCVKTQVIEEKKKRRERFMILVNTVAYICLIASFIAFVTIKNHGVMTFVFAFFCCTMTGCMTYSMLKLRKFSQLLAADGILASKHLLVIHVTSFWIVSILEIASAIVTAILGHDIN